MGTSVQYPSCCELNKDFPSELKSRLIMEALATCRVSITEKSSPFSSITVPSDCPIANMESSGENVNGICLTACRNIRNIFPT